MPVKIHQMGLSDSDKDFIDGLYLVIPVVSIITPL